MPIAGGRDREQAAEEDQRASAPVIAISEPTERSMPPVAMTSVMPTPTITMVQTWVRLTFSVCQRGEMRREGEVERDQQEERERACRSGPGAGPAAGAGGRGGDEPGLSHARAPRALVAVRHGVHDGGLGDGLAGAARPRVTPVAQHEDAVRSPRSPPRARRRSSARPGPARPARGSGAGSRPWRPTSMPRVGSSRISSLRVDAEPAGEQHLLLVAARELADPLLGAGALDAEAAR